MISVPALTLVMERMRLRVMTTLRHLALTSGAVLFVAACAREPGPPLDELTALPSPAASRSGESNLAVGPDGGVHMSWLERLPDSSVALRYARLTGTAIDAVNTFEAPETVSPKPAQVRLDGQRLSLTLPPRSVTVIGVRP